jgi:Immunity protein 10
MPTGVLATQFSVTEEHGVLVAAQGAESSEDDDFYLMLQHKDHYTEQDATVGMNQPYIEYCGQGWSWYGHIESFQLHRDRVKVQLDREAASHMRNDGLIVVEFKLGDDKFNQLRQALKRTFRDHKYFTEQLAV